MHPYCLYCLHAAYFQDEARSIGCEYVRTGINGLGRVLARVCILDAHHDVLLNTYVKPEERVTDHQMHISGVSFQVR